MKKIYFLVVIYNKNFQESKTCNALLNMGEKNVIIMDNSTNENNIQEFCKKTKWLYHSMNGNKGLSKAYNQAISILNEKNMKDEDLIVLLDDDTIITPNYVHNLYNLDKLSEKYNIFTPIIIDKNNKIISPSYNTILKNFKIRSIKWISKIDIKHFSAINTCLAIKYKILKKYKYNENIFLDNVDHQFFYDMRKKNEKVKVIDTIIEQDFFTTSEKNMKQDLFRKKIQSRDLLEYVKDKTTFEKFIAKIRIFRWKMLGVFKYRNFNYYKLLGNKEKK